VVVAGEAASAEPPLLLLQLRVPRMLATRSSSAWLYARGSVRPVIRVPYRRHSRRATPLATPAPDEKLDRLVVSVRSLYCAAGWRRLVGLRPRIVSASVQIHVAVLLSAGHQFLHRKGSRGRNPSVAIPPAIFESMSHRDLGVVDVELPVHAVELCVERSKSIFGHHCRSRCSECMYRNTRSLVTRRSQRRRRGWPCRNRRST